MSEYTKSYQDYKNIFQKTYNKLEKLSNQYSNDPELPFMISAYKGIPELTNRLHESERNLSRSILVNDTFKVMYFQNEIFHTKIELQVNIKRSLPIFYYYALEQKKIFEETKLRNYENYIRVNELIEKTNCKKDLQYYLDYKERLLNLVQTEKDKYEILKTKYLNVINQINIAA